MARYCTSVQVFSRAKGEGKYYTRVQCLAILRGQEGNDRITIYFTMYNWLHKVARF